MVKINNQIIFVFLIIIFSFSFYGCWIKDIENYNYTFKVDSIDEEKYVLIDVSLDGNKGYEFITLMNKNWVVIDIPFKKNPEKIGDIKEFGLFNLYDDEENLLGDISFYVIAVNKDLKVSDYARELYKQYYTKIGMKAIIIKSEIEEDYAIILGKYDYKGKSIIHRFSIIKYEGMEKEDFREDIIIIGSGSPERFEELIAKESYVAKSNFQFK